MPEQTATLRSLIPQSSHHTSHLQVLQALSNEASRECGHQHSKTDPPNPILAEPRGLEESCRCTRMTDMYFTSLCTICGWDGAGGLGGVSFCRRVFQPLRWRPLKEHGISCWTVIHATRQKQIFRSEIIKFELFNMRICGIPIVNT